MAWADTNLFVYEGFEYDPGHLLLKDGVFGSGTNVWIKPLFQGIDPGLQADVVESGLAFTNGEGGMYLQVNGRSVVFGGEPTAPQQVRYQCDTEVAFSNPVTFWTSYLFKSLATAEDGESCFAWGCDRNQNVGQYGRTIASEKRYNASLLMNKPYAFTSNRETNGPLVPGVTCFVVGKINLWKTDETLPGLNAYDITWWRYENGVDTVPTNEPDIATGARMVGTSANNRVVMRLGFYMASVNGTFRSRSTRFVGGTHTNRSCHLFQKAGQWW